MGLVEDEAFETVGLRGHERVEVGEQAPHAWGAGRSHFAQCLSERSRSGGVHDGAPLPRQLAHQRQRDDGLSTAGPTGNDDGSLGGCVTGPFKRVKDVFVGSALLIQQDELFPSLHLVGRHVQQLARGLRLAREEEIRGSVPLSPGARRLRR